jgi:hypothetical protein
MMKLTSGELDISVHSPLIEEVKDLLHSIDDHLVRWARRSGNNVAHKLAKEGCGLRIINSQLFPLKKEHPNERIKLLLLKGIQQAGPSNNISLCASYCPQQMCSYK